MARAIQVLIDAKPLRNCPLTLALSQRAREFFHEDKEAVKHVLHNPETL